MPLAGRQNSCTARKYESEMNIRILSENNTYVFDLVSRDRLSLAVNGTFRHDNDADSLASLLCLHTRVTHC